MPPVARIGDPITCGDVEAQGSPDVFVNGIPWTRVGPDFTAGHPSANPTGIASGSSTVFVNGFPAVRVGDPIIPHDGHPGTVAVGSPDVFAN